MISHIDYEKFGKEISPLNSIFLSLSSEFQNGDELETAEKMVWKNIDTFVSIYRDYF